MPSIAISVRWLHDANMSGALYLRNFVPDVGGFVVLIRTLMPSRQEGVRFDRANT